MYYITRHATIATPREQIIYKVWKEVSPYEMEYLGSVRNPSTNWHTNTVNWTSLKRKVVFETEDFEELQKQIVLLGLGEDLWYIYKTAYHE